MKRTCVAGVDANGWCNCRVIVSIVFNHCQLTRLTSCFTEGWRRRRWRSPGRAGTGRGGDGGRWAGNSGSSNNSSDRCCGRSGRYRWIQQSETAETAQGRVDTETSRSTTSQATTQGNFYLYDWLIPMMTFVWFHFCDIDYKAILRERVQLELEVRPKFLVADTNCYIDHLDAIIRLIREKHYTLIAPLVGTLSFSIEFLQRIKPISCRRLSREPVGCAGVRIFWPSVLLFCYKFIYFFNSHREKSK